MDTESTATILELDEFCLRKILVHLDMDSLTNLAEVYGITAKSIEKLEQVDDDTETLVHSKYVRFAKAVRNMFSQEYSTVWISNSKQSQKVLHHFGDLIRHLQISHSTKNVGMEEIEQAVLEQCCEKLVTLQLNNIKWTSFSKISKPFPNVEKLYFVTGVSGYLLPINKWFPKIRLLDMDRMEYDQPDCIEQYFPHLEEISIVNSDWGYAVFNNLHIAVMMHLNPQLKKLDLSFDSAEKSNYGICLTHDLIKSISRKLTNLSELILRILVDVSDDVSDIFREDPWIKVDSIKSLTVECFNIDTSRYFILVQSYQLEHVHIQNSNFTLMRGSEFDYLISFARKNGNIVSFKFDYELDSNDNIFLCTNRVDRSERWMDVVNKWPKLTTISIPYNWQSEHQVNIIVRMLCNNKNITQLTCQHLIENNRTTDFEIEKGKFKDRIDSCKVAFEFKSNCWDIKFSQGEFFEDVILSKKP